MYILRLCKHNNRHYSHYGNSGDSICNWDIPPTLSLRGEDCDGPITYLMMLMRAVMSAIVMLPSPFTSAHS